MVTGYMKCCFSIVKIFLLKGHDILDVGYHIHAIFGTFYHIWNLLKVFCVWTFKALENVVISTFLFAHPAFLFTAASNFLVVSLVPASFL